MSTFSTTYMELILYTDHIYLYIRRLGSIKTMTCKYKIMIYTELLSTDEFHFYMGLHFTQFLPDTMYELHQYNP